LYLVEQPPHCDLLRLSLSTGDLSALDGLFPSGFNFLFFFFVLPFISFPLFIWLYFIKFIPFLDFVFFFNFFYSIENLFALDEPFSSDQSYPLLFSSLWLFLLHLTIHVQIFCQIFFILALRLRLRWILHQFIGLEFSYYYFTYFFFSQTT